MSLENVEYPEMQLTSGTLRLFLNTINEVLHGLPKDKFGGSSEAYFDTLLQLRGRLERRDVGLGINPTSFSISQNERVGLIKALGVVSENIDIEEFHARLGVDKSFAMYVLQMLAAGDEVKSESILAAGLEKNEFEAVADVVHELCSNDSQCDFLKQTGATQVELLSLLDGLPGEQGGLHRGLTYEELTALVHGTRLYLETAKAGDSKTREIEAIFRKMVARLRDPELFSFASPRTP